MNFILAGKNEAEIEMKQNDPKIISFFALWNETKIETVVGNE
jgi:hypothetical protein